MGFGAATTIKSKNGTKAKSKRRRKPLAKAKGMHPEILKNELKSSVAAHTGRRLKLIFHGRIACTDGKHIILPELPSGNLIEQTMAMVFRGYVRHERQHVLKTDFDMLNDVLERYKDNKMLREIVKRTHNAIEDVRIEQDEVNTYAGAMNELNIMSEHINSISAANIALAPEYLTTPAFIVPVALTWAGRMRLHYPTPTNNDCLALLPPETRARVEAWTDQVVTLKNNAETYDLAEEIAKELFDELPPAMQEQDPNAGQGDSAPRPDANGQPSAGDGGNPGAGNSQPGPQPPQQASDANQGGNTPGGDQNGQASGHDTGQSNGAGDQAHNQQPGNDPSASQAQQQQTSQGNGVHSKPNGTPSQAKGTAQNRPGNEDPNGTQNVWKPLAVEPTLKEIYRKLGVEIEELDGDGIPYLGAGDADQESSNGKDKGLLGFNGFSAAPIHYVNIHAPSPKHGTHGYALPKLPKVSSRLYDMRITTDSDMSRALSDADGHLKYQEIKASIGAPMADAARVLRRRLTAFANARWLGGREDGELDTRRMTRIATGSTDIFRQKTVTQRLDTAVGVLIDNSGSMGSRIRTCQEMAIILTEAFRGTPIKFEMAGFTDTYSGSEHSDDAKTLRKMGAEGEDSGLELYLFKGYDDPPIAAQVPIGNMSKMSLGGTPTPDAIRAFYPRLYVRPERRKVLVVITDGLDDHDQVRNSVELLTKLGVEVIGIGIEEDGVRSSFDRSVVIKSTADLSGAVLQELATVLIPSKRST